MIAGLLGLAAARDGAVVVAFLNSRMVGNGYGVRILLLLGDRHEVDYIVFLQFIYACSFDPVTSLTSYHQSIEIDWLGSIWATVGIRIEFLRCRYKTTPFGDYRRKKRGTDGMPVPRSDIETVRVLQWLVLH